MSKRRLNYEKGLERLQDYFQQLFHEGEFPTRREIDAELNAILAFRKLNIRIDLPSPLNQDLNDYIVMFQERYNRYDDVIPDQIYIELIPNDMDDDKKLHQYLRGQV